jgi:hypothetical protein
VCHSLLLDAGAEVQDVDGVLLVLDAAQSDQERQLEQLYLRFAQPHSLTMKQCCVLAVSSAADGEARSWTGAGGSVTVCTAHRLQPA